MIRNVVLIAAILVMGTFCMHGIDVKSPVPFSAFQCLLSKGVEFVVIRGYTGDGNLDSSASSNLRLIQSIGLTGDIYMETCRAKNATEQANEMLDAIPSNLYNKVWVSIQKGKGSCAWTGN